MYPIFRLIKSSLSARKLPRMGLHDTHISHHICWPWDIDPWMELNNGRTLTLYDLGRIPLAQRMGLVSALRDNKFGLTIAGASVRYRRRVRMFDRFEIHSRVLGWDDRFIYIDQSMWRNEQCTSQALLRSAITDKSGIVSPEILIAKMDNALESPVLPDWVLAWIDADHTRPWPPQG